MIFGSSVLTDTSLALLSIQTTKRSHNMKRTATKKPAAASVTKRRKFTTPAALPTPATQRKNLALLRRRTSLDTLGDEVMAVYNEAMPRLKRKLNELYKLEKRKGKVR
jgi:hypothetical protein